MRPVGVKLLGLAMAAATFLGAADSSAAPSQNQAVVRAVRGTANYSTDRGANWRKLSVGNKLMRGSVVRTAPGSQVDLFLGDNGPVVRITEDTTMGIDNLSIEDTGVEKIIETQLDLRNGRILGNVKKLAEASKYEVKTPQGVAGIRGTRYDIRADGTVTVIEGTVLVVYIVNGQASTATVNAGQTARPPVTPGATPPVVNETEQRIQEIIREEPPTLITTPEERPVVVVEPKPNEQLQVGDKAKLTEEPHEEYGFD